MESIWTRTAEHPQFECLRGDMKTDVLVIGGGITGILCAYLLRRAGVDCALVEADRIGGGITKNTTAKLTVQHGLIYHDMIARFGEGVASTYLQAQRTALEKYRILSRQFPCDFQERDSYVYALDRKEALAREVEALARLGFRAELEEKTVLPFPIAGAVRVGGQAEFHPLKFLFGVAAEMPVFENTKVLELLPEGAVTNRGRIRAKKMIVATHFPFLNKHGAYFLKLYQQRSYVIALKGAADVEGMYIDAAQNGLSFRNYRDLLLLGGGGHRTGKSGGGWRELSDFARKYYPQAREVARWATQDCMTLDGIPYVGQYAKSTPNLYVATGFNKWGITSAMVAATLLCDLVQEKKSAYADAFSPSRRILRPQLALNLVHTAIGLLTPTAPRCPHLGCALKYNRQEHSWDCPCHGSRFTEDGSLIDNPATDDKEGLP